MTVEVRRALSLALVVDVDVSVPVSGLTQQDLVDLPPLLGPGQRVEVVDALVQMGPDGSTVLTLGESLVERLRALHAGSLARSCVLCGCTDLSACPGGCWWVTAEVCSMCAPIGLVPS